MEVNFAWEDYKIIWDKAKAFKEAKGRWPNYIDMKGYRIYWEDLINAKERADAFKLKEKRNPNYVTIKASLIPAQTKTIRKTPLLMSIEKAVGGTFKTATELYNLVKNENYSGYRNDIYPQGEVIARLEKDLPLNCADFSQIGYAALMELNKVYKKGYTVDYLRVACKPSGAGHIILRVKGGEFRNSVYYDLAEAASAGKPLGQTMCINGFTITNTNPAWLKSDDGKL